MGRSKPTFEFHDAGTLPRPGPIGRLSRLIFGLGALYWPYQLIRYGEMDALTNVWVIALTAFAVHLAPYTLNIGFGLRLVFWPRLFAAVLIVGAAVAGWRSTGAWMSPELWLTVFCINLYAFIHLGLSFLLAAVFGTPGCEMRAQPILIGRMMGHEVRDHECPGPIGTIDRWE